MRVQTLAGRAAESEDDRAAVSQVMPTVSNGHATNSIIGAHAIFMGQFVATAPSLSLPPRVTACEYSGRPPDTNSHHAAAIANFGV